MADRHPFAGTGDYNVSALPVKTNALTGNLVRPLLPDQGFSLKIIVLTPFFQHHVRALMEKIHFGKQVANKLGQQGFQGGHPAGSCKQGGYPGAKVLWKSGKRGVAVDADPTDHRRDRPVAASKSSGFGENASELAVAQVEVVGIFEADLLTGQVVENLAAGNPGGQGDQG